MGDLAPGEYEAFGLGADTSDAWVVAASAMMEAHCRRPTLLSASYTERLRVSERGHRCRLSYGPVVNVDAVRARYSAPRHDVLHDGAELGVECAVFGLPGTWTTVDVSTLDVEASTGTVRFPETVMGLRYSEAEVTYTAGLASVPDAVKAACAQIVKNAQATPGLNVRSSKVDTLQAQYFSDSLLDSQVCALLRPYRAERLG
jgi:hypothetical protein